MKLILCLLISLGASKRGMDQESSLSNPMKFRLPYELPDQNQDGFADNQDFQRAFKSLSMTRYEISALFD